MSTTAPEPKPTPRLSIPTDGWTRAVVTALLTLLGSWEVVKNSIEEHIDQRMEEQRQALVNYIDGRVLILQDSLNAAAMVRDAAMRADLQETLSAQSEAIGEMARRQNELNKRIPTNF